MSADLSEQVCECRHTYLTHNRKALHWPINTDAFACTFYACYCHRFTEVNDASR